MQFPTLPLRIKDKRKGEEEEICWGKDKEGDVPWAKEDKTNEDGDKRWRHPFWKPILQGFRTSTNSSDFWKNRASPPRYFFFWKDFVFFIDGRQGGLSFLHTLSHTLWMNFDFFYPPVHSEVIHLPFPSTWGRECISFLLIRKFLFTHFIRFFRSPHCEFAN